MSPSITSLSRPLALGLAALTLLMAALALVPVAAHADGSLRDCHGTFGTLNPSTGRYEVEQGERTTLDAACDDIEGTPKATISRGPAHGTLSPITATDPGFFLSAEYRSKPNYLGPDSFTLTIRSGDAVATIPFSFDVVPAHDDPPVCTASLASGSAPSDTSTDDVFIGQVESGEREKGTISCEDDERERLTLSATGPRHGTVSPLKVTRPDRFTNATFTYRSTPGYLGRDRFVLVVRDGTNTVRIPVVFKVIPAVNEPPSCSGQVGTYGPDGSYYVFAGDRADGSINCTDEEGHRIRFSVGTPPAHGTLSPITRSTTDQTPGVFTYTPDADYSGPESFVLKASDGTNVVRVPYSVEVFPRLPVDPPSCREFRTTIKQPDGVAVAKASCTSDKQPLTYFVDRQPQHGTVEQSGDTFRYRPEPGFVGTDFFAYGATDSAGETTREIYVTITVQPSDSAG